MEDAPGSQATLVTGILSVALCLVPVLGLIMGIASLFYAQKAKKSFLMNSARYMLPDIWSAGHILGIIGLILSLFWNAYLLNLLLTTIN